MNKTAYGKKHDLYKHGIGIHDSRIISGHPPKQLSVQPSQAHSTRCTSLDMQFKKTLRLNCELSTRSIFAGMTRYRIFMAKQIQLQLLEEAVVMALGWLWSTPCRGDVLVLDRPVVDTTVLLDLTNI